MCNIMKVNKTAIVYHKSDLDGVVSAAIATMYENSKNKDVIYIPYSAGISKALQIDLRSAPLANKALYNFTAPTKLDAFSLITAFCSLFTFFFVIITLCIYLLNNITLIYHHFTTQRGKRYHHTIHPTGVYI
jgi:hypothetical protein